MITGPKRLFLFVCESRGYTFEQAKPCVLADDGVNVTVDENHAAYPRKRELPLKPAPPRPSAPLGPGGHLKAMLSGWPFRITATPTCPCNSHARRMDEWGPDECLRRLDEIVGWLRAEAEGRKMPFSDAAARLLVRRAIWKARKSL